MISFSSAWTVTLRYLRVLKHDPNFVLGLLYWPILDILLMGFLGTWLQQSQVNQFNNYQTIIFLGLLLWQVVGRGANIICFTFAEEIWHSNIVNLFSLPLKTLEWMIGIVLFYSIMSFITTIICLAAILFLFDVSLWNLISSFLLFLPPIFFSGIWVGFTCLQICVSLGRRGMELAFVTIWFFAPFSGVYYPIEILPGWAQWISAFLPMSYVFRGMREYILYQQDPLPSILMATIMSIIYALCAMILFIYFFNRTKQKGLARLLD